MPKIPLSDMCAQDFVELTAALGLKYKDLAKALNLSGATVSLYSTGKAPIPEHVKTQLHSMCNERRRKLESLCHRTMPTIHSLIVATNELRAQEQAQVIPRLVHRDATPLTRTYPVYRMHPQKQGLYVGALAAYYETISNTLKSSNDQDSRRGLELELADTKALLESARGVLLQGAPYNNCITWSEWHVVSRALRRAALIGKTDGAWALYQHWRRHKGCGYPRG
jgi:DNA-binding Xre family transcriptional regulator